MPRPLERSRGAILAGVVAAGACLAVVYATPREAFWIVDCGHKALVAERLLETGFAGLNFGYPALGLDPEGRSFPMGDWAVRRGNGFVTIFPAAYPALAAPFLAWLGPAGLRVPAALGVGACAWLFALWLEPALGRRWAAAGGVILGLATPLFFYGVTVWEHSLTVALALGSWMVLSRPRVRRSLAAGFLIGVACWLREELALMGAALAGAALLHWRRLSVPVALAAGAAAPIAGLLAFNAHVYGDPLGPHVTGNLSGGAGAGGLNAAAREHLGRQLESILAGPGETPAEGRLLAAAALGAFAIGWAAARRSDTPRTLAWLLSAVGLGAWLLGFASVIGADRPLFALGVYNGLLFQMPLVAVAGLGLARMGRDPAYGSLRVGVTAGLVFLLLAVASGLGLSLAFGFGVHWGPRQILPALPALAALFLIAARRDPGKERARSGPLPRAAAISLIAAGVLSSALSAWLLAQQKIEGELVQNRILARPQDVVVTNNPLLAQHLAPLWHRKRMLLVRNDAELVRLVPQLARHDVGELLLLLAPSSPVVDWIEGMRCRKAGVHRGGRVHYHDLDLRIARSLPARPHERDETMTRTRPFAVRLRLRALASAVLVTPLLFAQAPDAADRPARETLAPECRTPFGRTLLRGRGKLVSPVEAATACRLTPYEGPRTRLYSDRAYHTATRVQPLVGRVFCPAERQGTRSWIVEVTRPTELLTLGNDGHHLEDEGWHRLGTSVRVETAGAPFDALYSKRFAPGRYVIRQDFSSTPPPVFWSREDVRIAP